MDRSKGARWFWDRRHNDSGALQKISEHEQFRAGSFLVTDKGVLSSTRRDEELSSTTTRGTSLSQKTSIPRGPPQNTGRGSPPTTSSSTMSSTTSQQETSCCLAAQCCPKLHVDRDCFVCDETAPLDVPAPPAFPSGRWDSTSASSAGTTLPLEFCGRLLQQVEHEHPSLLGDSHSPLKNGQLRLNDALCCATDGRHHCVVNDHVKPARGGGGAAPRSRAGATTPKRGRSAAGEEEPATESRLQRREDVDWDGEGPRRDNGEEVPSSSSDEESDSTERRNHLPSDFARVGVHCVQVKNTFIHLVCEEDECGVCDAVRRRSRSTPDLGRGSAGE